jgi:hypothetical protein
MNKAVIVFILCSTFLIAQHKSNDDWQTEFERSNYLSTDNYEESIKYFEKLENNSEFAQLKTIGISPQGRELKCLVVSKDKIFDPIKAKESGKAIILINNGIHSGEIEGKDACMIMLREMLITKEKSDLLENVILLIIPVFSTDGHERSSPYNRINQNGPIEMGWRTTAQNLNLNRDFTKADSPEMKAFLNLFSTWLPDIFIDTHTTDGADFQYTITYDISRHQDIPPKTRKLVNEQIIPFVDEKVEEAGFLISPFVGFINGDYSYGLRDWIAGPRFSNGYGAVQNRIGLLIETHMLKPYKERVFSTKALVESIIEFASNNNELIKNASLNADKYVLDKYYEQGNAYPINFGISKDSVEFKYKGFEKEFKESKIAGKEIISYTSNKTEKVVPYFNQSKITDSVYLPKEYIIPNEWSSLIDIIKLHGINVEKVNDFGTSVVEKYKFKNVKFSKWPYEGRFIPSFECDIILDTVKINKGDFRIKINQRALGMIAHLLEPKANDSFVKWGFMNIIFERKEYFEPYSMEPIAQKMYDKSDRLRNEFNERLKSDSTFAKSSWQRLNFFYERSPYYDEKHNVYPILRVVNSIQN